MDMKTAITRLAGSLVVSHGYPHAYAPCYKYRFTVVREPSTPPFNRVRHWLNLASAQPHTVIRPTDAYVVCRSYYEVFDDPSPSPAVRDYLENNGYEIVAPETTERNESSGRENLRPVLQSECPDCFAGYRCPDHSRSLS